MGRIMNIDSVEQYNDYFGMDTLHPLVTVIEGSRGKPLRFCKKLYNIYAILVKDTDCGSLRYGRSIYDYSRGTMLFLAPGQVMGSEDDGRMHRPEGWVLAFHPELLCGTPLARGIRTTPTSRIILTRPCTFPPPSGRPSWAVWRKCARSCIALF